MTDKRQCQPAYLQYRIIVTGTIDRYRLELVAARQWQAVLLQDVDADLDGRAVDLGHVWVQHADFLKALGVKRGERIRCSCQVTTYTERVEPANADVLKVVQRYGLAHITNIVGLGHVVAPGPPSMSPGDLHDMDGADFPEDGDDGVAVPLTTSRK